MNKGIRNIVPAGHIYIKDNVLGKESITGVDENKAAWAKSLNLPQKGIIFSSQAADIST